MTQADSVHSTPRRTASLRKTSPSKRSTAPTAPQISDPERLPDIYCLKLDGDCLEPFIPDRAAVMIKKAEAFDVGDVVVIWFRPGVVAPDAGQGWLKRVTMKPAPWVKFPYTENPKSDVAALIMVEQINPPINYAIKCRDILAVHKAVGYTPSAGKIGGTVSSGDMLPIGSGRND